MRPCSTPDAVPLPGSRSAPAAVLVPAPAPAPPGPGAARSWNPPGVVLGIAGLLVLARQVTPHLAVAAALGTAVGDLPAPQLGAVAARLDALAVDPRHRVGVAGQQRLGAAHLGAGRQLAFGDAVAAVLLEFRFRRVGLGPAGTEGALVHLAAVVEQARLGELRRAELTGVVAVAAADALVLAVQDDAVFRVVDAVDGAHRQARRVRAVHAGHRYRAFARHAVVDRDDAAAVDAPWDLVLVLASGHAAVAVDAALRVADEFHSCCHAVLPFYPVDFRRAPAGTAIPWFPASSSRRRSRTSMPC